MADIKVRQADLPRVTVKTVRAAPHVKAQTGTRAFVDYPRIESYVNSRINQVFAPVNSRMDALQHDIDEKIKLTDWMEA